MEPDLTDHRPKRPTPQRDSKPAGQRGNPLTWTVYPASPHPPLLSPDFSALLRPDHPHRPPRLRHVGERSRPPTLRCCYRADIGTVVPPPHARVCPGRAGDSVARTRKKPGTDCGPLFSSTRHPSCVSSTIHSQGMMSCSRDLQQPGDARGLILGHRRDQIGDEQLVSDAAHGDRLCGFSEVMGAYRV
jgi:hypothetical protein